MTPSSDENSPPPPRGEEAPSKLEALRQKAKGTTINDHTLLATDYLNHFNEIIMLIEMIPDMHECLEDARAWHPKTYQQHFRDSSFSDKELAIEAYEHAPEEYRGSFDYAVERMNLLVQKGLDELEKTITGGDSSAIAETARKISRALQKLVDVTSAIIHGGEDILDQEEIDRLL